MSEHVSNLYAHLDITDAQGSLHTIDDWVTVGTKSNKIAPKCANVGDVIRFRASRGDVYLIGLVVKIIVPYYYILLIGDQSTFNRDFEFTLDRDWIKWSPAYNGPRDTLCLFPLTKHITHYSNIDDINCVNNVGHIIGNNNLNTILKWVYKCITRATRNAAPQDIKKQWTLCYGQTEDRGIHL
jgi:hypothetical protein